MTADDHQEEPRLADDQAIEAYVAQCRARVDAFVAAHFSLAGTMAILRRTFLKDLVKYPINFLLSVPSLIVKNLADWLDMLGWDHVARLLAKLPIPLKMEFQAAVERLVVDELLEAPTGEARECLQDPLKAYRSSRLTILDGANSGVSVLAAYLFFGDSSISPYAMGDRIAREQAKRDSASGFFLGRGVGSVFYGVFPPHPSFWQVCLATSSVFLGMSVLATVTSLLADPLQQRMGVHKRQLERLIGQLEDRLLLRARKSTRDGQAAPAVPLGASVPAPVSVSLPPAAVSREAAATPVVRDARHHALVQWAKGVTAKAVARYRSVEERYGRQRTLTAFGATTIMALLLVIVLTNALRFDPYRETRSLIDAKAFPTAVARLDALSRKGTYQKQAEYWYLRGRALIGEHAYDAGADAYRSAIERESDYRDDDVLIADLIEALAKGSNAKAKSLLLTEIGPQAVSALADETLAKEKIDRWSVVDATEKLGGTNRLDYRAITLADLQYTTTCAEKKRAVQKVGEYHVADAKPALEELDAQPQWRCLQPQLKTMLAELASR